MPGNGKLADNNWDQGGWIGRPESALVKHAMCQNLLPQAKLSPLAESVAQHSLALVRDGGGQSDRGHHMHSLRAAMPKQAANRVTTAHRSPIVMIGRSDISASCDRPVLKRGVAIGKHPLLAIGLTCGWSAEPVAAWQARCRSDGGGRCVFAGFGASRPSGRSSREGGRWQTGQ
jgi:hypothetical protein